MLFISYQSLLKTSARMGKNKSESGSSCLNPLEALTHSLAQPFSKTTLNPIPPFEPKPLSLFLIGKQEYIEDANQREEGLTQVDKRYRNTSNEHTKHPLTKT